MYEEIYAQNKGLLIKLARRYARICELDRAVSMEDLTQAGFIGLMKAADSYDSAAGKSWASWASWYIRRELNRALGLRGGRFTRAHTGADTLDRPLSPDEDGATAGDLLADETLPGADEALLLDELRQGVREAVARLPEDGQRQVVLLCKLEGHSCRDAAERMGVDVPRARQLYARARASLSRDWQLRALADLDARTRFHAHKGVRAFNRDWTSVTEGAALWRIEQKAGSSRKLGEWTTPSVSPLGCHLPLGGRLKGPSSPPKGPLAEGAVSTADWGSNRRLPEKP